MRHVVLAANNKHGLSPIQRRRSRPSGVFSGNGSNAYHTLVNKSINKEFAAILKNSLITLSFLMMVLQLLPH